MSSSKSAFSDKSATWSLNSWKSIVKSPSLCPLLTRTFGAFGAFGARYFIKGYCQLFECGLICGTSPLERPKQHFSAFLKTLFQLEKNYSKKFFLPYTLWTVNDVPRKDPLERPPRGFFHLLWGHFTWKDPLKAVNWNFRDLSLGHQWRFILYGFHSENNFWKT